MPEEPTVAGAPLREVQSLWPTGVSVVTARHQGRDHGMTVNAFVSISLEPPVILVSLGTAADTTPAVRASGRFAVSLLSARQRPVSESFARSDEPETKFAGVAVRRTPGGLAVLDGSLATLEARVSSEMVVHDHVLFLGEVLAAQIAEPALPLVFHRRRYLEADGPDRLRVPGP